jgi:hypothetical protein
MTSLQQPTPPEKKGYVSLSKSNPDCQRVQNTDPISFIVSRPRIQVNPSPPFIPLTSHSTSTKLGFKMGPPNQNPSSGEESGGSKRKRVDSLEEVTTTKKGKAKMIKSAPIVLSSGEEEVDEDLKMPKTEKGDSKLDEGDDEAGLTGMTLAFLTTTNLAVSTFLDLASTPL